MSSLENNFLRMFKTRKFRDKKSFEKKIQKKISQKDKKIQTQVFEEINYFLNKKCKTGKEVQKKIFVRNFSQKPLKKDFQSLDPTYLSDEFPKKSDKVDKIGTFLALRKFSIQDSRKIHVKPLM